MGRLVRLKKYEKITINICMYSLWYWILRQAWYGRPSYWNGSLSSVPSWCLWQNDERNLSETALPLGNASAPPRPISSTHGVNKNIYSIVDVLLSWSRIFCIRLFGWIRYPEGSLAVLALDHLASSVIRDRQEPPAAQVGTDELNGHWGTPC